MWFWYVVVVLVLSYTDLTRGSCITRLLNDSTVDCLCGDANGRQLPRYLGTPSNSVWRVQVYCDSSARLDIYSFYDVLLRTYPNLHELKVRCVALANLTLLSEQGKPNFTFLREIDVAENNLTAFRVDTNLFTRVRRLDLRGNRLSVQSVSLAAFRNLTELDMSDNPLQTIDERTFRQLPNLTRLALRNCSLREVLPLAFYANRKVVELDLGNNWQLRRVSRELLLPMRVLRTVDLTNTSELFADCVPPNHELEVRVSSDVSPRTFCSCDRVWLLRSSYAIANHPETQDCLASLRCTNLTVRMRTRVEKMPESMDTVYLKYGDELRLDCDAPGASIGYFRTPRFDQFWFAVYATNGAASASNTSNEVYIRNVSEPRRSEEDAARIRVFANGTLQILRLGRSDAGMYVCIAVNSARSNETKSVRVLLDYTVLQEVKLESIIMGLLAATCCVVLASCVRIVLFIVSQCKKVRTLKRIRELVQWSETHFAFNTPHFSVPHLNVSGLVPHFVSSQFRRAPTVEIPIEEELVDESGEVRIALSSEVRPVSAALLGNSVMDSNGNASVMVEDLDEDEDADDDVRGVGVALGPTMVGTRIRLGLGPLPPNALPNLAGLPLPPEEHVKLQRMRESVQIAMQRLTAQYATQVDRFGRLKDYSSVRMERMRENYTEKLARFRTYRDAQFDKLRQNYKYQLQYLAKLWQALSLTQCVGEGTELEFDLPEAADFPVSGPIQLTATAPYACNPPAHGSHRELEAAARSYFQMPPERRPNDGIRSIMRVRPLVHCEPDALPQTHSDSCSYPRRGTSTFQQARTCRCQQQLGVHLRPVRLSLLSTNFNLPFVDELDECADQPSCSSARETCETGSDNAECKALSQESSDTTDTTDTGDFAVTPSDAGQFESETTATTSVSV